MAHGMQLKVMSARAVHVAVNALAADFTRATGCRPDITYAPVGVLQDRLKAGETADVVILTVEAIGVREKSGDLRPGSSKQLGRTSIGVAVRAGVAKPDITSPEAFKQVLLGARTVALSDPAVGGSAGIYLRGLIERMGLAEAMRDRSRPQPSGAAVAECVARGEAEIGMTFISEMLPVAGIGIVGPLPAPLGNDTSYAAGVAANCTDPAMALAFIEKLTDPARRDIWSAAGFEVPDPA
jgi:molybdate transport system substrate-binding protein